MLRQLRIHFLMEMPVPLKTFAEGCDALAAPVLTPDPGNLDSVFQSFFHQPEGTLVSALYAHDQTVVDPFRKLRLTSEKCTLLFQQFQKAACRLDADRSRNLPDLQLVKIRIAEIKVRVCGRIHMEIIMLGRYKGRLRVISIVIISACSAVFHIGTPGYVSCFVTSHTRLGSPEREMSSAQIEVGHLLSTAIAVLGFLRIDAEPEAVDRRIYICKGKPSQITIQTDHHRHLAAKVNLRSILIHFYHRCRQRTALDHIILNLKVAPVHIYVFLSAAHVNHRFSDFL